MEEDNKKITLHIGVDTTVREREDMEQNAMCGVHSYPWEFDGHTMTHINTLKDTLRLCGDKYELCIRCLKKVKEHISNHEKRTKMLKDRIEGL